jgi:flagellar hook-basal body complex protein FliE
MANSLAIEGLQQVLQADSGQMAELGGAGGQVSEARVQREMAQQGMETPHVDGGKSFADIMRDSVADVNNMQVQADTAIKELVAGRNKNIHETMLAVERADASLRLMMQVRNKVLDAYKEIMRMQV